MRDTLIGFTRWTSRRGLMAISMPDRRVVAASLAVALFFVSTGSPTARPTSTFVIAAAQGYGVEDCISEGGECGRVVADAWCEANGRGEAVSFGLSEGNKTGGVAAGGPRPYFITCGD
jgi:hypothetical protein